MKFYKIIIVIGSAACFLYSTALVLTGGNLVEAMVVILIPLVPFWAQRQFWKLPDKDSDI